MVQKMIRTSSYDLDEDDNGEDDDKNDDNQNYMYEDDDEYDDDEVWEPVQEQRDPHELLRTLLPPFPRRHTCQELF